MIDNDQYFYAAKVVKIIDGDTFDCLIDLGFDTFIKKRIRIFGIDAYETRTKDKEEKKKGIAGKKFLIRLMNKKKILLETIRTKSGLIKKTFDRYLAVVYVETPDDRYQDVGRLMIEKGHAVEYLE